MLSFLNMSHKSKLLFPQIKLVDYTVQNTSQTKAI